MASVVSAAVLEGSLIIGLDDGSIINAGYVQGPQGLRGDQGPTGATGSRGIDGNTIHTVGGTPRNDMGTDGDYAIDNINWRIYGPRSGGTWGSGKDMLPGPLNSEFKGTLINMGGGGGGGGGGGNADVILGENPPLYGSDGSPIKAGALWFDTDQKALYIAQTDAAGAIVWVITIPADRSILLDQVPSGRSAGVLPASSGGLALDGATWFNDTTGLWYIYNGKKKQWIDLPPGQNDLSMQTVLVEADPAIDENFEYNQADRDQYGEALTYGNGDDHAVFTRIVVSKKDNVGFDWSVMLRGITAGDQLTLVQVDEQDPNNPDDDLTFRSDFIVQGDPTENSESFSFAISWAQDSPDHLPLFGQDVAFRFKAIVNLDPGGSYVFYQDDAPDKVADELTQGNLWVDSSTMLLYVWTEDEWVELGSACGGSGSGGSGLGVVTTRDVKTIARDLNPFEETQELSGALLDEDPATFDPIDDLLKTQEDVNDFIGTVSARTLRGLDRTSSNLDIIQNTVSTGSYFRREKPAIPQAPLAGEAFLLENGGFEATLYAQVQNVLINKSGIGPFADFSFLRVGDNLTIQNVDDQDFGTFVVTNINDFNTFWDFAVVPAKNIAVGAVAEFDKQLKFRSTRPVFTIAQDTEPYFSESGQLWYDTANDALKVWDQEDEEFYLVGGQDAPEVDLDPIIDRLDNVEQLQRELHNIVSESVYNLPTFSLSNPEPQIGQYTVAATAYDESNDNQGIGEVPDFFEQVKMARIAAVAGSHARLDLAEVGDHLAIQVVGNDAGGKYLIEHIRQRGSGPNVYFEFGLKFLDGLADGNIQTPNDAQIQVIKPSEFVTKDYVDAGDNAVRDEVLEELDELRKDLSLTEYSFNYTLRQNDSGVADAGECLIVDEDPEVNQMFILHTEQRDGSIFDYSRIKDGDEIVFEQDLGHLIIYEVIGVDDTRGADQVFLNVNFLRYEGDAARAVRVFFLDRLALIYKLGERPGYVQIDGDEMTGALTVPEIKTTLIDSAQPSNIVFKYSGSSKFYVTSTGAQVYGKLQLDYEGTADNHAVTKAYVDAKAAGSSPYVVYCCKVTRITSSMGATPNKVMFTGPNGTQPSTFKDIEKFKLWIDDADKFEYEKSDAAFVILKSHTGQWLLQVQISSFTGYSPADKSVSFNVLGKNYIETTANLYAGDFIVEVYNLFKQA